ncbi:MAG: PBP1A family penicillin-binding protein, partial [Chthoniobacterales bacterium]
MKRFFVWTFLILCALGVIAVIAAGIYVYPHYSKYSTISKSFDLAEISAIPAISEVFDRTGQRYGRLQGETRYVVPLDEVSPHFIDALLAREDSRYYEHRGVDYRGIARATVRNIEAGRVAEGASTITQQLARNSYDLAENDWERKVIEALLALRMEGELTKDEILEAYVNRIYYGRGLYGIETAARACFGKTAKELDLSESAILAGLIRSPNRFTPLEDTANALAQRDQVLARMEELAMITPAQAADARSKDVPATKRLPPRVQEDYAMDAVNRDLDVVLSPTQIAQGGLKIYTTIDKRLQLVGQSALDKHLTEIESTDGWTHPTRADYDPESGDPAYLQGALVAIENSTGAVRALIGGRDFKESRFNRAILAKRQVGSTFKPFIYAAAFEVGLLPGTLVDDGDIKPGEIRSVETDWAPKNSDGGSAGLLPAGKGLVRSRNTMTVRVGEFATLPAITQLAGKVGLGEITPNPSIYLGAFEATLKEITTAYTTFPNAGSRRQSYIISEIVDRRGQTIYKATEAAIPAIDPPADAIVDELLQEVVTGGTAAKAKSLGLTVPTAGKTGTTDDYKDAWFVGYTSSLTTGVWVGFDQPKRIMNKGYGSTLALPIWVDFVENASAKEYAANDLGIDVPRVKGPLCRRTGLQATSACESTGEAYTTVIPKAMTPTRSCNLSLVAHGGTLATEPRVAAAIPISPSESTRPAAPLPPIAPAQPVDRPRVSVPSHSTVSAQTIDRSQ